MGKKKFTQRWFIGKSIDAIAGSEDDHGGRSVMHITCGHLTDSLLKNVFLLDWSSYRGNSSVNGKDGPDGNIDIDIGRSVQRVNCDYIFAAFVFQVDHFIVFLRYNRTYLAALCQRPDESDIGNNIQVLLFFPLHIDLYKCTNDICQTCPIDLPINEFCGQSNVPQELGQFTGGKWKISLVAFDESVKGNSYRITKW